jgi:hypothetical protein
MIKLRQERRIRRERQMLSDEAKKARREYARKWRAKNRKKIKEYMANYWERKAAGEHDENKKTHEQT